MGVGRIFSREGASRGFPQNFFQWEQKWWNLVFTPRNWKNNLFLLIISKPRGGQAPLSDTHVPNVSEMCRYGFCWNDWRASILSEVSLALSEVTLGQWPPVTFFQCYPRNVDLAVRVHRPSRIHVTDCAPPCVYTGYGCRPPGSGNACALRRHAAVRNQVSCAVLSSA